jgi:AcrR family transcriptional regulator
VTTRPRGRRPGGGDSRADILAAARDLFARDGYDKASMRAIARRARVDPSLIVHYFSSKEGLLKEALQLPFDPDQVLADGLTDVPDDELGVALVRVVLTVWDNPYVQPRMLGMLRTALSHDAAMSVLRQTLQATVMAAVSRLVTDEPARRRAELVGAQMAGVMLTRYVVRLPAVVEMSVDELALAVGPSVQHYLTGDLGDRSDVDGHPRTQGDEHRA